MAKLHIYNEDFTNWRQEQDMLLDYFSVYQRLHLITGPQSGKYPYMDEQLNDCTNVASDIYVRLDRAIDKFASEYPRRLKVFDEEEGYGIYWFNAAAALSNRTNMDVLLENMGMAHKNPYDYRNTFLRAVDSLDKEQHYYLLTEVYSILLRFVNVSLAYDVLTSIDSEMAELQAFLPPARPGEQPTPPPSAAVL